MLMSNWFWIWVGNWRNLLWIFQVSNMFWVCQITWKAWKAWDTFFAWNLTRSGTFWWSSWYLFIVIREKRHIWQIRGENDTKMSSTINCRELCSVTAATGRGVRYQIVNYPCYSKCADPALNFDQKPRRKRRIVTLLEFYICMSQI